MGGKILDYEAKDIKNEGRMEILIDLVRKGLLTVPVAAKEAEMQESDFVKILDKKH